MQYVELGVEVAVVDVVTAAVGVVDTDVVVVVVVGGRVPRFVVDIGVE